MSNPFDGIERANTLTDKQYEYIEGLCDKLDIAAPAKLAGFTRKEASDLIEELKDQLDELRSYGDDERDPYGWGNW